MFVVNIEETLHNYSVSPNSETGTEHMVPELQAYAS